MTEPNTPFGNLEMEERVKVPQNRIGVIIGKKGATKAQIERQCHCNLMVDSVEGLVKIRPAETTEDPMLVWAARDIVKAIARGFNEEKALLLTDPEFMLEIIPLDVDNKRRLGQLRGRLIGEGGRSREIIEQTTSCFISISGKTVSIIGLFDEIQVAKQALLMLINGQRHATVFRFLEKHRLAKKRSDIQLWQESIKFKENVPDERDMRDVSDVMDDPDGSDT